MILEVYSTSRAIRARNERFLGQNCSLNAALSLAEFLDKAVIVKGLIKADVNTRILIMQEAANAVKAVSSELKIPLEFFAFLKSSKYLFSFFSELKRQKVSIKDLELSDTYANFDEHLRILSELEKQYLSRLLSAGYYDEISICEHYNINSDYICRFKQIIIYIDGIPSKYELDIFTSISKIINVKLCFSITGFNKKLAKQLCALCGLEFKSGYAYELDLSNAQILKQTSINTKSVNVNLQGFELRSLQASFVFDEISKMIKSGIEAKNICVILPDEDMSEILRSLDANNMLNYAMGKSVAHTSEFTLLCALQDALNLGLNYKQDESYLKEQKSPDKTIATLNYLNLASTHYEALAKSFHKMADFSAFCALIDEILANSQNTELKGIIKRCLFDLSSIASKLKTSELLELFLIALRSKSLALVGGGEVTVMGLLESRGLSFDGVIIVDFNDNLVPRPSSKEMFLSSSIRARAGLISHIERENLQRFYYERLIFNAKSVSISYESSEQSVLSRFFSELKLQSTNEQIKSECYENALKRLCEPKAIINLKANELVCEHDFFAAPLSFSRLSTYLSCKRAYYYKYILGISEAVDLSPNSDKAGIGTLIHEILKEYFVASPNYCDKDKLKALLARKTANIKGLGRLDIELLKLRLDEFALRQNEHFANGYKVLECEKEISREFEGIKIKGFIDRIDENANELLVIDYKSGSLPSDDLQLQFYKALSGASDACYLDLKKSMDFARIKPKYELKEIIKELKELSGKKISFMCDEGCKHEHSAFVPFYKEGL